VPFDVMGLPLFHISASIYQESSTGTNRKEMAVVSQQPLSTHATCPQSWHAW